MVIDHLSKEGTIHSHHDTVTTSEVIDIFVMHIFSKHGIPLPVTMDCSSPATLSTLLDCSSACAFISLLAITIANDQVEHINSTLEQYLCIYCNYK